MIGARHYNSKNFHSGACEFGQSVRALSAKDDYWSCFPGAQKVTGENQISNVVH